MPHATHARQQLHRHGVQHFIAQHHATERRRQFLHPAHALAVSGQPRLLTLAQAARQVHDGVAAQRCARGVQRGHHLPGQCARAGAEFPDFINTRGLQGLSHLARQRPAEVRRKLGRGDKVAARLRHVAELARAAGVITQARCVQRQRHEGVKAQPAAGRVQGALQDGHHLGLCP